MEYHGVVGQGDCQLLVAQHLHGHAVEGTVASVQVVDVRHIHCTQCMHCGCHRKDIGRRKCFCSERPLQTEFSKCLYPCFSRRTPIACATVPKSQSSGISYDPLLPLFLSCPVNTQTVGRSVGRKREQRLCCIKNNSTNTYSHPCTRHDRLRPALDIMPPACGKIEQAACFHLYSHEWLHHFLLPRSARFEGGGTAFV